MVGKNWQPESSMAGTVLLQIMKFVYQRFVDNCWDTIGLTS